MLTLCSFLALMNGLISQGLTDRIFKHLCLNFSQCFFVLQLPADTYLVSSPVTSETNVDFLIVPVKGTVDRI